MNILQRLMGHTTDEPKIAVEAQPVIFEPNDSQRLQRVVMRILRLREAVQKWKDDPDRSASLHESLTRYRGEYMKLTGQEAPTTNEGWEKAAWDIFPEAR